MDIYSINFTKNKPDESNYNWIKNMLNIGIDNLITKWIDNNEPFRLVMIESKKCYMCDNKSTETWCQHTDDFNGKYNRCGWLYCKKCANLVEMSEYYYYKKQNYLTYSQTSKLRKHKFKFWRVSSNPLISPYIQENSESLTCMGNTLFLTEKNNKKRVNIPISWEYDKGEYNKSLYLSNLICFNRNILGYTINNLDIPNLTIEWTNAINKEYNLANNWSELLLVLTKNSIPNGVIRNICLIWGGFTSFI